MEFMIVIGSNSITLCELEKKIRTKLEIRTLYASPKFFNSVSDSGLHSSFLRAFVLRLTEMLSFGFFPTGFDDFYIWYGLQTAAAYSRMGRVTNDLWKQQKRIEPFESRILVSCESGNHSHWSNVEPLGNLTRHPFRCAIDSSTGQPATKSSRGIVWPLLACLEFEPDS